MLSTLCQIFCYLAQMRILNYFLQKNDLKYTVVFVLKSSSICNKKLLFILNKNLCSSFTIMMFIKLEKLPAKTAGTILSAGTDAALS